MTATSPSNMPFTTFDISSIACSPPSSYVGLKPSPRSQLCYTGSTATPTFVGETSFEEDEGFFLLSPEDLTESDDFTIGAPASNPLMRRLLPRRLSDDWSSVEVCREESPMLIIDAAPAPPSIKRSRPGSFVLAKRSRPFDSNFLRDSTGTDYHPQAHPQPSETNLCHEDHMPVCIPLTPTSPGRCYTFVARSPPSLHHDYSNEIEFCGHTNSDLLLPILS